MLGVLAKRREVRVERREAEGMKKKASGAAAGDEKEKEKEAGVVVAGGALKRRARTTAQSGEMKSHQVSSVRSFRETK